MKPLNPVYVSPRRLPFIAITARATHVNMIPFMRMVPVSDIRLPPEVSDSSR